jgi:phage tail sheath gpL-like
VSIAVAGVPADRKTPGINFNVILGGPGTSAGAATVTIELLGNHFTSAITGASPAFSVAGGTATAAVEVFVPSAADALTLFGQGSELHRMARQVFAQYPSATVYACPVADAGGTAASGVITFATSASAAFTVRLKLCGLVIDVPVASGDSVTTIAGAVADAINDNADLPYTAQNSSGVVTITAKQTGPRGNVLVVDAYFVAAGSTNETRITTSSTSSGAGTTGIWSSTGSMGAEITLSSGATQDSFANALAAINPVRRNRIVCACIEATNADLVVTEINAQAGPTVQILEQAVMAFSGTYANAVTLATGRNAARLQVVWHHASALPPPDVAAQVAAARLAGDTAAGGVLVGEASDPAANLDGVNLATIPMQRLVADRPTATEIEGALNNGLTVLAPSALRPSLARVVRSVTSRSLANGVPNYAVIDTAYVTVVDYCADDLRSYLTSTLQGAKLGADGADGNPASRASNITTPSIIRGMIYGKLRLYEEAGILRDVDNNASLLAVQADSNTPGRVNCEIPTEPVSALHQVAGNVRQLASL